MADAPGRKRHLLVRNTATPQPYTYPLPVRGGGGVTTPGRNRAQHGTALLSELSQVRTSLSQLQQQRAAAGVQGDRGTYLEFHSEPQFELALRSLDRADRRGENNIELMAVRQQGDVMLATVFVPEGRLAELEQLIKTYAQEDMATGKPKNRTLVESISGIRRAALESFWTDAPEIFPVDGAGYWWEVWLRAGADQEALLAEFRHLARRGGLRVGEHSLRFPDRTVVLAYGTVEQMTASVELLDCVAELRRAKQAASFFTELSPREQREWSDSFLGGLVPPGADAPAVCLLDTGVNRKHPLIAPALEESDLHAYNPAWRRDDHGGHGTEMAGLALYGDLTDVLASGAPLRLEHRLESVKILAPPGFPKNDPELYGAITKESIARAEVTGPGRRRAVSMAVTTTDFRDRGEPSSWSAELDDLCFGFEDGMQRLFFVSAGNVEREDWVHYPDRNDVEQVHDPGQAWNAITVGACTEKITLDGGTYPGWLPLAPQGMLSPSSTTSLTWKASWPNKPDIVLEGGNAARNPADGSTDPLDDLALLTTHWRLTEKLFVPTGDTSAATALAARMGAILSARYPQFWPETLRALLVHSADWTDGMLKGAGKSRDLLLRRYGYGVPHLDRACWSASNTLTIVAQDELQPFIKPKGKAVKTKDMNLHELPWPQKQLQDLFATEVELRVTLSYFVEPNPARRGWKYRHRYASHGLRFAMRKPGESIRDFKARVSKAAQEQEEEAGVPEFSEPGWMLGRSARNRGSIHSDRWRGTAVELADRQHLAVFPVGGWWKERPPLERWRNRVRYALVVSIHTPETGVDIYTPVETMVQAMIETE